MMNSRRDRRPGMGREGRASGVGQAVAVGLVAVCGCWWRCVVVVIVGGFWLLLPLMVGCRLVAVVLLVRFGW